MELPSCLDEVKASGGGRLKIKREKAEVVTCTGVVRAGSWAWAAFVGCWRAAHDCHRVIGPGC
jgi:hypothetical protein